MLFSLLVRNELQHAYKSHGSIIRTTGEDVDLIEHVISNFMVLFFFLHIFYCCPWHTPFSAIYGGCGPSLFFYVFIDNFFVFTNIGFIFCAIRNLSCVYISIHRLKKTQKIDVVAAFSKASTFSPEIRARLVRLSLWKNESFLV